MAQAMADKNDLEEHLQFPVMANAVIEQELDGDLIHVSYTDEHGNIKSEEIYGVEQSSVDEEINAEATDDSTEMPSDPNKLKYACTKCDESFSLKVDLKVRLICQFIWLNFF